MDPTLYAAVSAALLAGAIAGFCLGMMTMAAIVWAISTPLNEDEAEPFRFVEDEA